MMNEKLIENLKAAKALIDTPEKWGRGGSSYIPVRGKPLCVLGACDQTRMSETAKDALREHIPARFGGRFIPFNDHPDTTHADIMALFNRAIAAAEAAQ